MGQNKCCRGVDLGGPAFMVIIVPSTGALIIREQMLPT